MTANAPKPTRPPRTGGRERRFTHDEILDAALELMDTEGVAALSMRRLAEALGVAPMTVYGYIRTKEELLDAVATKVFTTLDPHPTSHDPWDDQLADAIHRIRRMLTNHPASLELLLLPEPLQAPELDHVRDNLLAVLHTAGLDQDRAVHAIGSLVSYVVGFAATAQARARRANLADQAQHLRQLDANQYPALTKAADEWINRTSDQAFDYGLQHLINGIRTDLHTG